MYAWNLMIFNILVNWLVSFHIWLNINSTNFMPNVIGNGNAQHIVVQHHYQVSYLSQLWQKQGMSQDSRMFRKKNVYIYTSVRSLSFPYVGRKETRKYTQRFSHIWAYYQTRENVALYLKSCIMKIHPKVHMQVFYTSNYKKFWQHFGWD